ncbi:MAG: aspartate aminotransferase family protein [Chloroflexi bacterium]|nr:aspartate aminotransferase family protein [Chloroflexota bacterium]
MNTPAEIEHVRLKALNNLWIHNRDWTEMAESGGPHVITSGKGLRVTDSQGNNWIDVNAGYSCVNIGYGRPEIAQAAYDQINKTPFCPIGTTTETVIKLAEKLAELAPGDLNRVFFSTGGSEANETALKIAKAYHNHRGEPGRYRVISRKGSYHGMTGGVLWTGDGPAVQKADYGPAYPGMLHVPQPNPYRCEFGGKTESECAILCAQAIEDTILFYGPETISAFIGEPIAIPQGAPVPSKEYWSMVREICDRYGVIMIADEVVCGFGRTGKMFAMEHFNVAPDIMTVAKGIISAYLPMAGTIVSDRIADSFSGGDSSLKHVLTNSGHPVSAAAALKNISIIEEENMVDNAKEVGGYFKDQLENMIQDHPYVGDVRGIGLFLAMELVSDRQTKAGFDPDVQIGVRLTEKFKSKGLIFRARENILHFGPPLCITRQEVDEIVHAVDLGLWEFEGECGVGRFA